MSDSPGTVQTGSSAMESGGRQALAEHPRQARPQQRQRQPGDDLVRPQLDRHHRGAG